MSPTYAKPLPRVALPGATEAEQAGIAAAKAEMEWNQRTSARFLHALLLKGKPFTGVRKPAPKPTKHQRHKAAVAVRSAYLKSVAA